MIVIELECSWHGCLRRGRLKVQRLSAIERDIENAGWLVETDHWLPPNDMVLCAVHHREWGRVRYQSARERDLMLKKLVHGLEEWPTIDRAGTLEEWDAPATEEADGGRAADVEEVTS